MKKLAFVLAVCLSLAALAQQKNSAQFNIRKKSDTEKIVENVTKINGEEVYTLVYQFSFDPKEMEGLDHIQFVVDREGEKATSSMKIADFIMIAPDDEKIKGNKRLYPKIVTFAEDAEKGTGHFYSPSYDVKLAADYFFSKKGTDYSNSKSVDSYVLTCNVYGYKFVQYVQEKDLNGEWQTVPKYGSPIAFCKPATVTVITSDKIKPMGKVSSVGDVTDLLKIGE